MLHAVFAAGIIAYKSRNSNRSAGIQKMHRADGGHRFTKAGFYGTLYTCASRSSAGQERGIPPTRERRGTGLISNDLMFRGKTGLFGTIESAANQRSVKAFVALTSFLFAVSVLLRFAVPEIGVIPYFMAYSAVMLLVSVAELVIIRRKKGVGNQLKWIIGIGFIASAVTTTSTLGAVGSVIYVFPILLSIQYCSVLYSLFISAVTIMGTFVPLLLSSRLANFDLNVVRLAPGTVIEVSSTLEEALGTGIMNEAGTKFNELLSIFFPMLLFVSIFAAVTVSITSALRRSLLEQYHQFQNTRE